MILGGPFLWKSNEDWRSLVKSMEYSGFLGVLWFLQKTGPPKSSPAITFIKAYTASPQNGPIFTKTTRSLQFLVILGNFHRNPGSLRPGSPRSLISLRNINDYGRSVSVKITWNLKNLSKIYKIQRIPLFLWFLHERHPRKLPRPYVYKGLYCLTSKCEKMTKIKKSKGNARNLSI